MELIETTFVIILVNQCHIIHLNIWKYITRRIIYEDIFCEESSWKQLSFPLILTFFKEIFRPGFSQKKKIIVKIDEVFGEIFDSMEIIFDGMRIESR